MATLADIMSKTKSLGGLLSANATPPDFSQYQDVTPKPIDWSALSVKQKVQSPAEVIASADIPIISPIASALQKTSEFLFPRPTSDAEAKQKGLIQVKGPISGEPMYIDPTMIMGSMTNVAQSTFKAIAKSKVAEEILGKLKSIFPSITDEIATKAATDLVDVKTSKGVQTYLQSIINDAKVATQATTQTIAPTAEKIAVDIGKTALPQEALAGKELASVISQEAKPIGNNLLPKTEALTPKIAEKESLLNLNRLAIGDNAGKKLLDTIESIRPTLEKAKGKPLSASEVLKAAQQSSILTKGTSREATLKSEAALLKTRQNLSALAEGKGVTKDFIDQLKVVSAEATRRGRELQALGITADPIENTTKAELIKKILDTGADVDAIIKAAEGVDFTNLKQATEFFRKFIPPTLVERLDEYRYINLLSSPRTHIINAFSNLLQGTILNPATRLANGAIDAVMSTLTGKERQVYMSEVKPYAKGFLNAVPKATKGFIEALKGNTIIERPDLARLPTGSALLKPFQVIPRMLEASDVLFRTLIQEGELQALASRATQQGKELTPKVLADIQKQATDKAAYYVFRAPLDVANKTGQGKLLSAIDQLTSVVYQLRKVPGIKWFVPFVQTPMNILKQGIEYSPLGIATLPGAANKTEQIAKTMIGSTVFLGAASLGLNGRLTWSAPTNKEEQNAFYNSGRQPYSVKIGDKWVSYSKLGPLAYPLAMASAVQWYEHENPKSVGESSFERGVNVFNGVAGFFTDQSYLQGMSSLLEFASGQTRISGIQSVFSSTVGQVVPLSSLQRWAAHIIDPVYRKPQGKFNVTNLIQSIQKDIPFLSTGVPKIEGSQARQNPVLNAVSPLNITDIKPRYERQLQQIRSGQRIDAKVKAIEAKTQGGGHHSLGSIIK